MSLYPEADLKTFDQNWLSPSQTPELQSNSIHLWVAKLGDHITTADRQLLTTGETQRSERIVNLEQRERYIGGRVGLRKILSGYTALKPEALSFSYADKGKPILPESYPRGQLGFNYSVSQDWGLYGFAWNQEVGVDLEVFPRTTHVDRLLKRKMTELECDAFNATAETSRNNTMLACWTRKEALGKAVGVGVGYRMNEVSIFYGLGSPIWQCGQVAEDKTTTIAGYNLSDFWGMQLKLPFAGAGALVCETPFSCNMTDCDMPVSLYVL